MERDGQENCVQGEAAQRREAFTAWEVGQLVENGGKELETRMWVFRTACAKVQRDSRTQRAEIHSA